MKCRACFDGSLSPEDYWPTCPFCGGTGEAPTDSVPRHRCGTSFPRIDPATGIVECANCPWIDIGPLLTDGSWLGKPQPATDEIE